jgi:putative SOS response-associated peptidase YedK
VICEEWRNGDQCLNTLVQVTTPANMLISRITDRMPEILPRTAWATWLGETGVSLAEAKAVLQTFDDDGSWAMTEQVSARGPRASRFPKNDPQGRLF